jgi:hypothetical protein
MDADVRIFGGGSQRRRGWNPSVIRGVAAAVKHLQRVDPEIMLFHWVYCPFQLQFLLRKKKRNT